MQRLIFSIIQHGSKYDILNGSVQPHLDKGNLFKVLRSGPVAAAAASADVAPGLRSHSGSHAEFASAAPSLL